MKTGKRFRVISLQIFVTGFLLLAPGLAHAACNTEGCWSVSVKQIDVANDGRIWIVTTQSIDFENLDPANGCTVGTAWTGTAEYAIFIKSDDPGREEKLQLALTAFTSDQTLAFETVAESSTGLCAVGKLSLAK